MKQVWNKVRAIIDKSIVNISFCQAKGDRAKHRKKVKVKDKNEQCQVLKRNTYRAGWTLQSGPP